MRTKAWIRFVNWTKPSHSAVCASLNRIGIDLVQPDSGRGACTPGILMHGSPSELTGDEISRAVRTGSGRLIVVVSSTEMFSNGLSWRLLGAGVSDVLNWHQSDTVVQQIAARLERWAAIEELLESELVSQTLVGRSPTWKRVLRQVVEVARFTDASALITGESGTGKELVARLIHELDPRPKKREFVVVDCTTVVPTLSGSEFFGHEKGAFTGAIAAREGAFSMATEGTLFLDEVGELPLPLQAELLRVVQEGTYKRVGSNVWRSTNFRLICATNRNLLEEESAGRFRRDLYYRIAGWVLRMPSLRERREDITTLTEFFLASSTNGGLGLEPAVTELLMRRDYPGNVRDLRHLVWRMSKRHVGPGPISVGDLPDDDRARLSESLNERDVQLDSVIRIALARGRTLKEITKEASEAAIKIACAEENGNLQRAARRLGVTDRALQLRRAASQPQALDSNSVSS